MMESVKLMLKGGVIGVANIIPGVSGGTMAVVMGIYERLIHAIGNVATDAERRMEYIRFLGVVGIGAVLAVFLLSGVMDYLLTYHKVYTHLFFIGLVGGSIPAIYQTHSDMRVSAPAVLSLVAGVAVLLGFSIGFGHVEKPEVVAGGGVNLDAARLGLLLLSGFLAGGSMIVPGISGSLMLLLMGQYAAVIKAIRTLDVVVLGVVAIGAVLGVVGFARLIDALLKRFPKETFYFILGLVVASLYPIFPGLPETLVQGLIGLLLVMLGGAISFRLGQRG